MFHRIHIPLGILLIAAGLVHGLFAGNPLGTTFRQASFGKILFTWKAEENAKMDDSENLVTFSGAILKDGTYEGAADGYASVIKVSVVVENGAVTDISIVEENDTPQFFEYAKEIINTILNKQSLEADGITGATYSSKGIQNAVYDALQNAVISGELKISDIQISNGHGHGKPHHRPKI